MLTMLAHGLRLQMRHRRLRAIEHAVEIDIHHLVPALGRDQLERRIVGDGGVADQDVEPAPCGSGGGRPPARCWPDPRRPPSTACAGQALLPQIVRRVRTNILVEIAHQNARTFLRQDARRREADAARGAGDKRHSSCSRPVIVIALLRVQAEVGAFGQRLAAVDDDGRAGDVGGLVGGEEQDGVGDVARRAEAAERDQRPPSTAMNSALRCGCTPSVRMLPGSTPLTVMP